MTTANPPPMDPQGNNPFGENNPFSDSPYAVPPSDPGSFPPGGRAPTRSMVSHVPVVAILMMVQGGLELLMGLGLVAMGGIFPVLMRMDEMRDGGEGPPPEMVGWMMLAIYGGLGVLTLVAAGLHLFAGLRNYRFRSRTLGLVALSGGLVTVFTCYCADLDRPGGLWLGHLSESRCQSGVCVGRNGKETERNLGDVALNWFSPASGIEQCNRKR